MRALFAVALGLVMSTSAFAVFDVQNPGDANPGTMIPDALVPCTDDVFCSSYTEQAGGYVADGEWNPASNSSGFMTTGGILVIVDAICQPLVEIPCSGPNFDLSVPRGFAWDKDAASGKFWVGSWVGATTVGLMHMDALGNEIAFYPIPDPGTGLNIQPSGLAMDYSTGYLWAILRNNPAGTVSRFMVFDTNVPDGTQPVVLGGPWDTPWNGGPSAVSSAGLEYRQEDCTIVALRQDSNNLGVTELTNFQDVGIAAPTLLGFCSVVNTPCTGAGAGSNRPWGISLSEDPAFGAYVLYSDLNLAVGCGTIDQPQDFHIIALPPFPGECGATAVEPSTWGKIKHDYNR